MISEEDIAAFETADKVRDRVRRGVKPDRWMSAKEMPIFMDAYGALLRLCVHQHQEIADLLQKEHDRGLQSMELSDDTKAT
jgi:hypothetical protein